ncbi:MAG: hypothetical protein WDZ77_01435 [Candidatus Pacearchaeota archaeon]
MVALINDIAIIFLVFVIHIVAIIYTWKVGLIFNSRSWNFIMAAFIILLFWDMVNFLNLFELIYYDHPYMLFINQIYLPLIFWILISLGMARIYYNIRHSMNIEKKLKNSENTKKSADKNSGKKKKKGKRLTFDERVSKILEREGV